jgi:hypothetical protein
LFLPVTILRASAWPGITLKNSFAFLSIRAMQWVTRASHRWLIWSPHWSRKWKTTIS